MLKLTPEARVDAVKHLQAMLDFANRCPKYTETVLELMVREINSCGIISLTDAEVDEGRFTGKLQAVKMYKDRNGCSLITAKESVERFFAQRGLTFYSKSV